MKKLICPAVCLCLLAATWSPPSTLLRASAGAQRATTVSDQSAIEGPRYNAAGELIRPTDYREWVFVSSGLGMTYGPAQAAAGPGAEASAKVARAPMFDNVFVARSAYRAFMDTGRWPDKTMFILEIRRSLENVSINNGGRTQGEVAFIEAAVKDVQRFKDTGGWAYFDFRGGERLATAVAALPRTASCYSCHANNTAVENTFVQFYPELFAAATKHATIKATFDPSRKP